MTHSAIYEGEVHHVRLQPRRHEFRYRLYLMYLDLDELPELFARRWLWSARRPNLAWFRRADYLGAADVDLRTAVRDRVASVLGRTPRGPVRMLTHMRTFGYAFNPVTFYYCFDAGEELDAVVAEITNTPWGERHAYVLDASGGDGSAARRFRKEFHVSPFFGMDLDYEWHLGVPGDRLQVRMTNLEQDRPVFHAGLDCVRHAITGRSLARALVRHPLLNLRLHAAIYFQAARLRLKNTPFHAHPRELPAGSEAGQT